MKTIKLLQYNMGGMRSAAADAEQMMNKEGIDVALLSEVSRAPVHGYQRFDAGRAAILIRYGIEGKMLHAVGETVAVRIGDTNIVSTYWSPNESVERSLLELDEVIRTNPNAKWLIGGDLNIGLAPIVKYESLNWRKQQRTEAAQTIIDSYGFAVWNDGSPTCFHMGYESVNDYTLTLGVEVRGWSMVCTPTMCDHQYIVYQIEMEGAAVRPMIQRKTDIDEYTRRMTDTIEILPYDSGSSVRASATSITEWLSRVIVDTTVEMERKNKVEWWHPGLERLKSIYMKSMVKARRCRNSELKAILMGEAKVAKKRYTNAIYQAKENAWKSFITRHTAWGKPYRVIVNKQEGYGVPPGIDTGHGTTETRAESEEYLLEVKFPVLDIEVPRLPQSEYTEMEEKKVIDMDLGEEIAGSLKRCNNKSSPGSDGIRWKHLKILHKKRPKILTDLVGSCLAYGVFPTERKEAFVSFIPKKDKPSSEAGLYRPISLLSCLGKLLETAIKNRLQDKADRA